MNKGDTVEVKKGSKKRFGCLPQSHVLLSHLYTCGRVYLVAWCIALSDQRFVKYKQKKKEMLLKETELNISTLLNNSILVVLN